MARIINEKKGFAVLNASPFLHIFIVAFHGDHRISYFECEKA